MKHFPVEMRLYQGSTLRMFLFSLMMNELMRYIEHEVPGQMLLQLRYYLMKHAAELMLGV